MGRPDQGNKAQTPVGFGTRGLYWRPGYGSCGGGCSGYTGGARICVGAGDVVAGATVHALRRPQGVLHGVAGTASRPQERRRSDDVSVEESDGVVVRWIVWRAYLRRHGGLGGALTRGTRSSR